MRDHRGCDQPIAPFRGSGPLTRYSTRLAPWAMIFRPSGLASVQTPGTHEGVRHCLRTTGETFGLPALTLFLFLSAPRHRHGEFPVPSSATWNSLVFWSTQAYN